AAGGERGLKSRPSGGVDFRALRGEPGREPIERATHLVELADTLGIELRHLEAAAAAVGQQALPIELVQRVGHRLARDAEPFGELVLGDALPWQKAAVRDCLENPRIDLLGQIGRGVERDHDCIRSEYGIPYSNLALLPLLVKYRLGR